VALHKRELQAQTSEEKDLIKREKRQKVVDVFESLLMGIKIGLGEITKEDEAQIGSLPLGMQWEVWSEKLKPEYEKASKEVRDRIRRVVKLGSDWKKLNVGPHCENSKQEMIALQKQVNCRQGNRVQSSKRVKSRSTDDGRT